MERILQSTVPLEAQSIIEQAKTETGLEDFAWSTDDPMYQGFVKLLTPGSETYAFSSKGQHLFSSVLLGALKNRLYLARQLMQQPTIAKQSVDAPFFITGMPRSGTTLLQNLMACDEERRVLKAWQANSLNERQLDRDKIAEQEKLLQYEYRLMKEQKKIHYVDSNGPEECGVLLRSTFVLPFVYQLFNRNMDFTLWHLGLNHVQTYKYFKQQLQALQFYYSGTHRWTLKSPLHIFYADALFKIFPDARFIVTHRDPRKVLPSTVSLGLSRLKVLTQINELQYKEYAATTLLQSEFAAAQTITQLKSLAPEAVCHVQYNDLLADPVAVVKNIYHYFNETVKDSFVQKMEAYLLQNPQHKYGKHAYSLQQYDISEQQLMNSFETYINTFSVKLGQ